MIKIANIYYCKVFKNNNLNKMWKNSEKKE